MSAEPLSDWIKAKRAGYECAIDPITRRLIVAEKGSPRWREWQP
jgi:hypothetical protein